MNRVKLRDCSSESSMPKWRVQEVRALVKGGILVKPFDGNHGELHPKRADYVEKGVPFIMASDISSGKVDTHNCRFISREQSSGLRIAPAENGDVLLSHKGTIGRSAILKAPYEHVILTPQVTAYRIKEPKKLAPRFLRYYFMSPDFQSMIKRKAGDGSTRAYIGITKQLSLPIRYVDCIEEQERIVAILDEAFADIDKAKANTEKNLENARELFNRQLNYLFSSDREGVHLGKIGDVIDFKNGFAFKSGDKVPNSNVQLLRMGNLYQNRLDLTRKPVYYPNEFLDSHQEYVLKNGDLVLSLTGTKGKEDYGYAVVIPEICHSLLLNQRIARVDIRDTNLLTKEYLLHFLHSRYFLDKLYPTANGTRQGNLSTNTIRTLPIPLCSIQEQRKLTDAIESLRWETSRLQSIYQSKLASLDELKQSLLHQAFTGQL